MTDQLDRAAEVLEVHEVVFIDHEVGYECGCNEHGDGHPDGLPFLTDALKHQARALDKGGLLASPEYDAAVAARALREAADALDAEPSRRESSIYGHEREFADGADIGIEYSADLLRDRADRIEREAVRRAETIDDGPDCGIEAL